MINTDKRFNIKNMQILTCCLVYSYNESSCNAMTQHIGHSRCKIQSWFIQIRFSNGYLQNVSQHRGFTDVFYCFCEYKCTI